MLSLLWWVLIISNAINPVLAATNSSTTFGWPGQIGKLQITDHVAISKPDFLDQATPGPDKEGLIADTKYFFLYQVVFTGFLYVAPQSISKWSDEQKDKDRFESWKENVSRAVWDEDEWTVNYIGHPYFGAAYYIRARERGYDRTTSFWYSAALSTTYEYGIEAMFENPSIQDLIVTPVLGSALGYYFEGLRTDIRTKQKNTGTRTATDNFLLNLTDPLGYLNQYMDKWFGSDVDADIAPFFRVGPMQSRSTGKGHSSSIGLLFNIQW